MYLYGLVEMIIWHKAENSRKQFNSLQNENHNTFFQFLISDHYLKKSHKKPPSFLSFDWKTKTDFRCKSRSSLQCSHSYGKAYSGITWIGHYRVGHIFPPDRNYQIPRNVNSEHIGINNFWVKYSYECRLQ